MLVIGLTGGIAMGKSTVAAQCEYLGIPVCNADHLVHQLLAEDKEIIQQVGKHFPEALVKDSVDRKTLGAIVFGDDKKLALLESILHPREVEQENQFIHRMQQYGKPACILEIPLLFETGAESRCDAVMLASAPAFLQRKRALRRPNMTKEKLKVVLVKQLSDYDKRLRSDFIIPTGLGKAHSFRHTVRALHQLGAL